LLGMARL